MFNYKPITFFFSSLPDKIVNDYPVSIHYSVQCFLMLMDRFQVLLKIDGSRCTIAFPNCYLWRFSTLFIHHPVRSSFFGRLVSTHYIKLSAARCSNKPTLMALSFLLSDYDLILNKFNYKEKCSYTFKFSTSKTGVKPKKFRYIRKKPRLFSKRSRQPKGPPGAENPTCLEKKFSWFFLR